VTAVLQAEGLVAGYGGSAILQDVGLVVEPGSITGIIGPNGAGKSTLAKVLVGYLHPQAGRVWFRGKDVTKERPSTRIQLGLAYVAQARSSFPDLTVLENLHVGGYLVKSKPLLQERLERVLDRFPVLKERRRQPARLLSGGELRILEIGRFLMMDPTLVILDEPSIGLAPRLVDHVYEQVRALRDEGITFLIVEQNVRKLLAVADYVLALEVGRNRYAGTPTQLVDEGHLATIYLGSGAPAPGAVGGRGD
jgi:branched-chain amino acid transport system ATP-binding protein